MNQPRETLIEDIPDSLRRQVVAYFIRQHTMRETRDRFSIPLPIVEEIIRRRIRPEHDNSPKLAGFPGHGRRS